MVWEVKALRGSILNSFDQLFLTPGNQMLSVRSSAYKERREIKEWSIRDTGDSFLHSQNWLRKRGDIIRTFRRNGMLNWYVLSGISYVFAHYSSIHLLLDFFQNCFLAFKQFLSYIFSLDSKLVHKITGRHSECIPPPLLIIAKSKKNWIRINGRVRLKI